MVTIEPTFEAWRERARALLNGGVAPETVIWRTGEEPALLPGLFGGGDDSGRRGNPPPGGAPRTMDGPPSPEASPEEVGSDGARGAGVPDRTDETHRVPRQFLELARNVAAHRDDDRFDLLYRVLWRVTREGGSVLERRVDPDIRRLYLMEKAITRDCHKMKAFVRFRKVETPEGPRYLAWHRPDHPIVPLTAPFFVDRFKTMRWSILTPDASAHWDGSSLTFGAGCPRHEAPRDDQLEEVWRAYYASIYNPARLNLRAMQAELPVRHWATLPEASLIWSLVRESPERLREMFRRQAPSASGLVPADAGLETLRRAAADCDACGLCRFATQTVFGEGPVEARLVIVGEQPGDQEDLAGRPFLGPAGALLDRALAEAGIDRARSYVTNAVKHFKFRPDERGKRRIHQRPEGSEIAACKPWLEAELRLVRPEVLLCLGRTAAQSILGRAVRIEDERGRFLETSWTPLTYVTLHPSAILRMPDEARQDAEFRRFVAELRQVARALDPER